MNGEFLSGISRGIFTEQERMRQEQKERDKEQKLQTIQLISSLAPQVEPESAPLLLKHLGDLIGIKGRMRKFWNVFSGQPDLSIEAQLGEKMKEITSGFVGPETAKQAREVYKGELLAPFRAQGTRPRTVASLPYRIPPSLASKMVLRDPRAEESEEFKQRLGTQLEHNLRLQEEKSRLDLLAQQARDRVEAKKQEVQMRLQFNKELGNQIKFYRQYGVNDPKQARRLALNDYADLSLQLGIPVPALIPDDFKALDKVQAQINRLNQPPRVGGRSPELITLVEYMDSQGKKHSVDAKALKTDGFGNYILPPGSTLQRIYTMGTEAFGGAGPQIGGGGGGGMTLEQKIQILKDRRVPTEEIINAIRQTDPQRVDELVEKFNLKAPKTPLQEVEQDVSLSETPLGKALLGIGERYDKSTTVGWLRTRLQAAEARLSREKDPVKRTEFQALVNDLRERLSYAESQMGLSPSTVPTLEETRRQAELDVMRGEVNWLRSQLDYAEKQMAISPGVVQKESLRRQIVDLKRRLTYAEGELKKKEAEGKPKVAVPPQKAIPPPPAQRRK